MVPNFSFIALIVLVVSRQAYALYNVVKCVLHDEVATRALRLSACNYYLSAYVDLSEGAASGSFELRRPVDVGFVHLTYVSILSSCWSARSVKVCHLKTQTRSQVDLI